MGGTFTPLRAHCCTRVLGTKEGDFSSRINLPSATYLNLVNAEFLVLASFFRAVRVGTVSYTHLTLPTKA